MHDYSNHDYSSLSVFGNSRIAAVVLTNTEMISSLVQIRFQLPSPLTECLVLSFLDVEMINAHMPSAGFSASSKRTVWKTKRVGGSWF